ADSSLFYDRISDQLWLYYISEDQFHFTDVIRTISIDGLHWSTPERVIHAPDYQVVMPTVAKIGDQYWLWSVNAGGAGCSASSTLRAVSNILGRRALVCTTPHRHCPAWLSNLAHRGD